MIVAQEVAGKIHIVSGEIESYFHLKKENDELNERVAELESLVQLYTGQVSALQEEIVISDISSELFNSSDYRFIPAKVVYNSTSRINNHIVLRKGSKDGVKPDMGVISPQGIVGVVRNVSSNLSLVIPVLNAEFRPSCKIKNNNYFGPLTWDGKDTKYAFLRELPRHADWQIGDTIVTSGYSSIFPEGLPIGIVVDSEKQNNDNYTSLKVELFTDFNSLTNAIIVVNALSAEQNELQNTIN